MEYKTHVNWVKLMIVRDAGRPTINKFRILGSKDARDLAVRLCGGYFSGHDREEFVVIGLDGKNKMTFLNSVSVGCLTSSIVHPREVFKMAILGNAVSLVFVHNHPTGDPSPSPEDVDITKRLVAAGDILGIKVLDHLIIGDNDQYVSFADKGLL